MSRMPLECQVFRRIFCAALLVIATLVVLSPPCQAFAQPKFAQLNTQVGRQEEVEEDPQSVTAPDATLLLPSDFPSNLSSGVASEHKRRNTDLPQDLRTQILKTYGLVLDLSDKTPLLSPRGWISARTHPTRALSLGTSPGSPQRPSVRMEFPLLPLQELAYFRGEGPMTSQLNGAIRLWADGRLGSALVMFQDFDSEVEKNLSKGSIPWLTGKLIQGFFYLHLAGQRDWERSNLPKVWSRPLGAVKMQLSEDEEALIVKAGLNVLTALNITSTLFWDAMGKADPSVLITSIDRSVYPSIYRSLTESPQFFREPSKSIQGSPVTVKLRPEPVDSLVWLRTVAPAALWNAALTQRGTGTWQNTFAAYEKLEDVAKRLEGFVPKQLLPNRPVVAIGPDGLGLKASLLVFPRVIPDMLASIDLIKASAHAKALEIYEVLLYSDKALRVGKSSDLAALAFLSAGNVYFDLGNVRLARRAYAYSVAMSESLGSVFPYALWFGSESAFWGGDKKTAARGFTRFLDVIGDNDFGPWARLRMAELSHWQGDLERATLGYEEVRRLFPHHLVAKDAIVRIFCLHAALLTPKAREKAYAETSLAIIKSRFGLQEQAKACLLQADLKRMSEVQKTRQGSVREGALQQVAAIDKFAAEFPESEFRQLFTLRKDKLALSKVLELSDQRNCAKLVSFYTKHENAIEQLGRQAGNLVPGLEWGERHRERLARCSAVQGNLTLWQRVAARQENPVQRPLQKALEAFLRKPAEATALKLFDKLRANADFLALDWALDVDRMAATPVDELVEDTQFWNKLGLSHLLAFDLGGTAKNRAKLRLAVVREAMAQPSALHSNPQLCQWVLAGGERLAQIRRSDWDALAKTLETKEWIALLEAGDEGDDGAQPKESKEICQRHLARALLNESLVRPSSERDQHLLMPYLENRGPEDAPEEWLAFAQRQARVKKMIKSEVLKLFERIRDDAGEQTIREAATVWIEKNAGKNRSLW